MPEIIIIVLAAGWTLTSMLFIFRIRGLREANQYLSEIHAEITQQALEAEKRAGVAETDSQYMKITLANLIQRPAVAILTDENIQQLGAVISGFKPGMGN
jgi:hypothetical protein